MRIPGQPLPKMQVQFDVRKVRSNTQVRSSSGSSKRHPLVQVVGVASAPGHPVRGYWRECERWRAMGQAASSRSSAPRSRRRACRDGGHDLALYGRDASTHRRRATPSVVCFPETTAEVQACVRAARRHGRPFVARGLGHRAGRRRGAARRRRGHRHDADGPHPRRSTPTPGWRGCEPGVLNLDLTRAVAPPRAALRARPVEPAGVLDRRQRRQQLGRAALPRRRRDHRRTCWPSRSCCPTARSRCSAASTPSPTGSTCAACSSAARARSASPPRIAVRLVPIPPVVRHAAARLHDARRPRPRPCRRSSPPASCPRPSR